MAGKSMMGAWAFLVDVKELVDAGTSETLSASLQMVVNKLQDNLKELECREVGRWIHNSPRDNKSVAMPVVQESDGNTWHCYLKDSRPVSSTKWRSSPPSRGRWKWKSEKSNIISKPKKIPPKVWR